MRPIPVPDWVRRQPWVHETTVVMPPDGDMTNEHVSSVEVIMTRQEGVDVPVVGVVVAVDEDDIQALREGGLVWLGFWEWMPVFQVEVLRKEE